MYGIYKQRMPFFIGRLWRILLLPLYQQVPIVHKLLITIGNLMVKDFLFADHSWLPDCSLNLLWGMQASAPKPEQSAAERVAALETQVAALTALLAQKGG